MQILRFADRIWVEIERFILSVTTILMSLMLVSNAISRYFFNKSWPFTEEIGKMGVLILTFMGLGYAARKGMHIEMSGLFDMMSQKVQRILRIFINIVSFIILGICTVLAFQYVKHVYDLNQVSTILRIPLYLVMLVIPLGFLLASIRYLVDFLISLTQKNINTSEESFVSSEENVNS